MKQTPKPRRGDLAALQARRLRAGRLFARGKTRAQVARELGVSRVSAGRWYGLWEHEGIEGLRGPGRTGRHPRLEASQLQQLEAALLAGPAAHGYQTQVWTLPRIARLIRKLFGVSYHPGHVWRILRRMGWSAQRPERQAKERDEAGIARWHKRRWPQRKRGG
jgi:transposase